MGTMIIGALILIFLSAPRTKSALPTILLLFSLPIAVNFPLYTPPKSYPEELHFSEYRADYEAVVDLIFARETQLPTSGCNMDLPAHLEHVSSAGCPSVFEYSDRGMTIMFSPIERY